MQNQVETIKKNKKKRKNQTQKVKNLRQNYIQLQLRITK